MKTVVSNQFKKTSVSSVLSVAILFIAFTFTGCTGGSKSSTDTNSLAADINNLASDANKVSVTTDQLQAVAEQVMVVLEAAGAIDSNVADKVEKISAETDKVQTVFDNVVAALKANNIAANSDNIEAVLHLILQINSATASVNPWSTWIYIIVTAALALLSIWKTLQASKSTAALTEVIKGGEEFKATTNQPAAVIAFKEAQDKEQSAGTKIMVAKIKAAV